MTICHFDGCCEAVNPGGHMGFGFVVYKEGKKLFEHSSYKEAKKENTNNVAEYMAFINCVHWLSKNGYSNEEIVIKGDSKLVINQMKGDWRIKSGAYLVYANKALEMIKGFDNISFVWVPREENEQADLLSKLELEKRGIESRDWKIDKAKKMVKKNPTLKKLINELDLEI